MNTPNYIRKLLKMAATGEVSLAPRVQLVEVAHDDGCAIFRGATCDCDPAIRVKTVPPSGWENVQ